MKKQFKELFMTQKNTDKATFFQLAKSKYTEAFNRQNELTDDASLRKLEAELMSKGANPSSTPKRP